MSRFADRHDAGRVLASTLANHGGGRDVLVLALPRGGVPVGYEVAQRLGVPLDVFVVRKLGVPGHEELAMGAIASGGARVFNDDVLREFRISEDFAGDIAAVVQREKHELRRRERLYRGALPSLDVTDRTLILVDDGLATGATMRAAVAGLRQLRPARIVVAIPVAAPSACEALAAEADDVVCPLRPADFQAVGQWYDDFSETSDDEVRELLARARREQEERDRAQAPVEGP